MQMTEITQVTNESELDNISSTVHWLLEAHLYK